MNFRKVQNVLAVVVTLGALVGLISQNKIEDWWQRRNLSKDHRPIIGHLESLKGSVKFRKPNTLTSFGAVPGMNLHSEDSLLTEEGESAVISFNSGLKVELEPHSVVVITDSGPEMIFLKGHVKLLNEVPGITLPPEALTKEALTKEETVPAPQTQVAVEAPRLEEKELLKNQKPKHVSVDEKISLPYGYISTVIKHQATFLHNCYEKHLKLDPDTQGRIDTSLVIERDGSVSTARVIGSTIDDPTLQQCIVKTLQRAKFRSFAGDPIVVNYPITFD